MKHILPRHDIEDGEIVASWFLKETYGGAVQLCASFDSYVQIIAIIDDKGLHLSRLVQSVADNLPDGFLDSDRCIKVNRRG